jgi:hypothetical protein
VDMDVLDPSASPRSHGDDPGLHGPTPLEGPPGLVGAEPKVGGDEQRYDTDGHEAAKCGARRRPIRSGCGGGLEHVQSSPSLRCLTTSMGSAQLLDYRGNAAALPPSTVTTQPVVARAAAR